MTGHDEFGYGVTMTPSHGWAHGAGGDAFAAGSTQPRDDERRETNIVGAVLATIGLVTALLCALAYGDVISLQSRYTVPGILFAIGATALVSGTLGLLYGRRG